MTQYEVRMYRDISSIAKSLDIIAKGVLKLHEGFVPRPLTLTKPEKDAKSTLCKESPERQPGSKKG